MNYIIYFNVEQMQQHDLLVIGNLTLDVVHEVDRIPEPDETGLVLRRNIYFGGRAGNIGIVGAKLRLDVAIASIVGGNFLESGYKDHLLRHMVNIDRVEILKKEKCAEIYVYKQPDGKHAYFFQPNVQRCGKSLDLKEQDLMRFKVIYLTSFNSEEPIIQLMTKIKHFNNVFFGFGEEIYRKSRGFIESAIKISSYLHLNAKEFEILLQEMEFSSVAEIFNLGNQLKFICISLGEKGSIIYVPNRKYVIPAVLPVKLMSTLGAGDAYVAGLIYGIINQWSVENCGRLGSVLSSFILEGEGAQSRLPQWRSIKKRYERFFGTWPSSS